MPQGFYKKKTACVPRYLWRKGRYDFDDAASRIGCEIVYKDKFVIENVGLSGVFLVKWTRTYLWVFKVSKYYKNSLLWVSNTLDADVLSREEAQAIIDFYSGKSSFLDLRSDQCSV